GSGSPWPGFQGDRPAAAAQRRAPARTHAAFRSRAGSTPCERVRPPRWSPRLPTPARVCNVRCRGTRTPGPIHYCFSGGRSDEIGRNRLFVSSSLQPARWENASPITNMNDRIEQIEIKVAFLEQANAQLSD